MCYPVSLPVLNKGLKNRCFLLLIFLWLGGIPVHSQDFAYRNYGTEEGLPSSEVYQIIQDKEGFMWFATDQGVARFDGYSFQSYTVQHGLPDNVVFGFSIDNQERLWVFTLSRKLAYLEDGTFHQPPLNAHLDQIPLAYGNVSDLVVHGLDDIVMSMDRGPAFHLQQDTVYLLNPWKGTGSLLSLTTLDSGRTIAGSHTYQPDNNVPLQLRIDGHVVPYPFPHGVIDRYYKALTDLGGDLLLANNHELMRIRQRKVIQYLELGQKFQLLFLFSDQQGDLWASTIKKGVLRFHDGELSSTPTTYLEGLTVSSIFQDHEGNYWFSTLENGVFFIPGFTFFQVRSRLANLQRVNCLAPQGKRLFLGMKSGEVVQVPLRQDSPFSEKIISKGQEVRSLTTFSNGLVINNYGLKPTSFYQDNQPLQPLDGSFYFFEVGNGSCWAFNRHFGYQSTMNSPWKLKHQFETSPPITSVYVDSLNTVWVGTNFGLFQFTKAAGLVDLTEHYPALKGSVRSIVYYPPRKALLLSLKGIGLFFLTTNGVQPLPIPPPWKDVTFNSLQVGTNNEIWAGTNKGLFRFWPNDSAAQPDRWTHYSKADGLPSNEVHEIKLQGDTLFLATSNGAAYFDHRQLPPARQPSVLSLNEISVNGKPYAPGATLALPADSNNLTFRFFGLNYRQAGNLRYAYRLLGAEDAWLETSALEVRYAGLAPGSYTFELREVSQPGMAQTATLTQSIEIRLPIWKRAWFSVGLALLIGLVIYYLFHRREVVLRKEYQMHQALNESEQKALRAQINPHFIFNALNSIQKFILSSDQHSAQKYLSIFSRIIRQSLKHSDRDVVPLSDEIKLLENYVKLEALRLNHPVHFEVHVKPPLNAYTVQIPPMLIQPFIENAIWHGLQPKEGPGTITLSFAQVNDQKILCEVRDNGVGMPEAREDGTAPPPNEPSGLNITQKRVKLLWQRYKIEETIHINHLYNDLGQSAGTEVAFMIPIQF